MTVFLKAVFGIMIFVGLFVIMCATCVMVIAPDWLFFTAGMIGYAVIGIAAVGFKVLDRK